MTARRPIALVAATLAAAFALTLTACSAGEGPEAAAATAEAHRGPLSEYLAPIADVVGGEEANLALNTETQEAIASCMADAGFDYIPYATTPNGVSVPVSDAGTRDWVARRGYGLSGGVVEGPELEAMLAEDAANAELPQWVNPNTTLYAQLSPGTQAAYDLALYGPGFTEDDGADDEIGTRVEWTRDDGCSFWASGEVTARRSAHLSDYDDLAQRMIVSRISVDSQPRMVDLTTEWAHCMADAGHVYTSPTHAWESVYAVIQGDPGPDGDPYVTSDEAKALEIEVALADFDCRETLKWDEVRNSVVDEVEAQFLADNKAEIDEFIAAVLQGPQP
ncbi:hypothetical protein SAMN05216410_1729 [Sanguibacter gelidistatuariae]|uniref:TRAP-type C4-dicarboxylate transport system, substrate-binding protein n=1 Tax=Sanguibacter gelidistatuariae TaxID=1814289 RepID=A0A1G6KZG7_9MICO|nr:hypothetical protein [Sanguibacter gelidistatuariae]SDC36470.1 hypothetical protein SAMN05216410_1729 [Sanguibacter gelidistatuariae]